MNEVNKTGHNKNEDLLEELVRRLLFFQDEATFLGALQEAVGYASNGNDYGVKAMSEAIRRRCKQQDVKFFEPNFGGLNMRSGNELVEAEDLLLEMAKANKLLSDPYYSQNLISAAFSISEDGLQGLVKSIFSFAGAEQAYEFQLLFNQMHSTIRLKHAKGERSWTEQNINTVNSASKYAVVSIQISQIENALIDFKAEEKSVDKIVLLIKRCTPWLSKIGNEFGFGDSKYVSLSTDIARTSQNYLVERINETLGRDQIKSISRETFKKELYEVHRGMAYVSILDMDQEFRKNIFSGNYSHVRKTCYQVGVEVDEIHGKRLLPDLQPVSFSLKGFRYKKISQIYDNGPPYHSQTSISITRKPLTKRQRVVRNIFIVSCFLFVVLVIATIISVMVNNQETKQKVLTTNKVGEKETESLVRDSINIETTEGKIKIRLFSERAPVTTSNFIKLVNNGSFNDVIFKKLINSNFVESDYSVVKEIEIGKNDKGTYPDKPGLLYLELINSQKAKSKIILTFEHPPRLGGDHFLIGEISEGLEVVKKIGENLKNKNKEFNKIKKITLLEN